MALYYIFSFLLLPKLNNERLLGLLATGASKSIKIASIQLLILDSFGSFFLAHLPAFANEGSVRPAEVGACGIAVISSKFAVGDCGIAVMSSKFPVGNCGCDFIDWGMGTSGICRMVGPFNSDESGFEIVLLPSDMHDEIEGVVKSGISELE
jgi:hypothetical protein